MVQIKKKKNSLISISNCLGREFNFVKVILEKNIIINL